MRRFTEGQESMCRRAGMKRMPCFGMRKKRCFSYHTGGRTARMRAWG